MSKNIVVKKSTWERLRKHGNTGDSFDDVVNKVLDEVEKMKPEGDNK